MSFTVNVTNSVRVDLIWFDRFQQRELGNFAIHLIQNRIRNGIALNDQPAPPLSRGYARRKIAKGLPSIRNLTYTGAMLNSLTLMELGERIVIGFPDPRQAQKAGVNQGRVPMIGLSRFDQKLLIERHDEIMSEILSEVLRIVAA